MSSNTSYELEKMSRRELVGRYVVLSDGREGGIVHVEYDSPERVALVKTCEETPSPLPRAAVARMSPSQLPFISELLGEGADLKAADKEEASEEETEA